MLCMTASGCLWEKAVPGNSALYDDLVRGWAKWNSKHAEDSAEINEQDYPHVNFFDNHINHPALRRLLLTMLNPDPAKRVSMDAVANNRWLKIAECCCPESYDPAKKVDASKASSCNKLVKLVTHNHLPRASHFGHKFVRLPGSTNM